MFNILTIIEAKRLLQNKNQLHSKRVEFNLLTSVNKMKYRDANTKCFMCGSEEDLYRLQIADADAESAFFLPLCNECAKEIADELLSSISTD